MQSNLSPEEKAIFGQGIRYPGRSTADRADPPGQYLSFGVKVLTSDVNNSASETENLRYHAGKFLRWLLYDALASV